MYMYTSKEDLELLRLLTMELWFVKNVLQDLGVLVQHARPTCITLHEAFYVVVSAVMVCNGTCICG